MVDKGKVKFSGSRNAFAVTIGGSRIAVDPLNRHAFETLAVAIEARIAFERATTMIAATGEPGVPLWLVAGPAVFRDWLVWSKTSGALAKTLVLNDRVGAAPVCGDFVRRARRQRSQTLSRVRIRAGEAVAERIELSCDLPVIAELGHRSMIRVAKTNLAETVIAAVAGTQGQTGRRRVSEILDLPFFTQHDFNVIDLRNDGTDLCIEIASEWVSLAPVPAIARACVPTDADPVFLWRATQSEIIELDGLAASGTLAIQEGR